MAEADAKLEVKVAAAEASLAEARAAALKEIENVAVDATRQIVAKVANRYIEEGEARASVKEVMDYD